MWRQYYLDMPFDDNFRYYRPAALIAALAGKTGKRPEAYVEYLRPSPSNGLNDVDESFYKAFGLSVPRS